MSTRSNLHTLRSVNSQISTFNKICKLIKKKAQRGEDVCYSPLHMSHSIYKWISYISIDQVQGIEFELEMMRLALSSPHRSKWTNSDIEPIHLPPFDLNIKVDVKLIEMLSEVMLESITRGIDLS